jgi:PAS domain S-box-containing protein
VKSERRAHDLFLLMLNLTRLRHRERMVDFFVEAINALWEELRVRVATDGDAGPHRIPIATNHHRFGAVIVEASGAGAAPAPEALAMVRNGVAMLAVILENRLQDHLLTEMNSHLEASVRERTAELEDANRRLRREVMERKRSESALRTSEERYRLLVENASDAVLVVQADRIRFHNPRARRLFDLGREQLANAAFTALVRRRDVAALQERILGILGGETLEEPVTVRLPRANGEAVFAEGKGVLIEWEGEEAVLLFLRDVTGERRLEDRLRLAMKMEAVGTLAGGLAHDFNNRLAPILGYAELALEAVPPGSDAEEYLQKVVESSTRARDLVHRILTFSRQRLGRFRPLDLPELVSEVMGELRSALPPGCKMELAAGPAEGGVDGDPDLLRQAIRHICRNAVQAVEQSGGIVRLSLERVRSAAPSERELAVLGEGGYLRLRVTDTGAGMTAAVLEKCFEPYFTTRPTGRGEGLGLAVAHGIFRHHGGQIAVRSEPGAGTVVSMYLPLAEARNPKAETVRRALLADDDPASRAESRERLAALGFAVTDVGDGLAAFSAFHRSPAKVDLLMADLHLPGMGGERLTRAVRQSRPGLPVILCASYLDAGDATGAGADAVLSKPFSEERLARTVRKLLAPSGPAEGEAGITTSDDP